DDRDLVPLEGLLPFLGGQPRTGPLSMQHLERDPEQEDPAGDLEGRDREAESREDPLAEDGEDAEGDRRRETGLRHDLLFLESVHVVREDGKEGDHSEGVHDREDGGHGGGAERPVHHGLPWISDDQCLRISFIQPPLSYTARLRLFAVRTNSSQVMTWSFSLSPLVKRSVLVPLTLPGWSPFTEAICRAYSNEISFSAGMFPSLVRTPPIGGVLTTVRHGRL